MKRIVITLGIFLVAFGTSMSCRRHQTEPAPKVNEIFLFIADDTPQSEKNVIGQKIRTLVGEVAVPDDIIHVVSTPSHELLTSISIPSGAKSSRLRKHELREPMQRLGKFLRTPVEPKESCVQQLQLPSIPATVHGLRRHSDSSIRIILIGNPIYEDRYESGWSMTNGVVPSDSSLTSELCPFFIKDKLPDNSNVRWLSLNSSWGSSPSHEAAVVRFYQLFFQSVGGSLQRFTNDPDIAFGIAGTSSHASLEPATPNGDPFVGMVSSTRRSRQHRRLPSSSDIPVFEKPVQRLSAREPAKIDVQMPNDIQRMFDQAIADPTKVFLAINWVPIGEVNGILGRIRNSLGVNHSDIDMWVACGGHQEELNFMNRETPFGTLFRDIRQSGSIDGDTTDFQRNWECVELRSETSLSDVKLWLNTYATDRPVRVRLIAVWNATQRQTLIEMPAERGDRAGQKNNRSNSKAWKQVDLIRLFNDSN